MQKYEFLYLKQRTNKVLTKKLRIPLKKNQAKVTFQSVEYPKIKFHIHFKEFKKS